VRTPATGETSATPADETSTAAAPADEPSAAATTDAGVSTASAAASHLSGCHIGSQCRRAERRDSRKRDDALV
jgi:hypothetical protein